VQGDAFVFQGSPKPLTEHAIHPAAQAIHTDPDADRVQHAREARARELAPSAAIPRAAHAEPWAAPPWSVLNISGRPWRAFASSSASMQKSVSMLLETRHDKTRPLAQFITATRYIKPRRIEIYVMFVQQT
jgi:hypothetical protein